MTTGGGNAPLDLRLIFGRTELGNAEVEHRRLGMDGAARRVLLLIDGHRRLSDIPLLTRARELEPVVRELIAHGLITLLGIANAPSPQELAQAARLQREALEQLRGTLTGTFERELGPAGRVLEARLADCVNLDVLRQLIREAVDDIDHAQGPQAAQRVLAIVRPVLSRMAQGLSATPQAVAGVASGPDGVRRL